MKYPDDFINKIICGDCIGVMKGIPDKRVDLVLTDSPYGIGFMGKEWDNFKPEKINEAMVKDKRKHTQIASQRRSNTAGTYDLSLRGKIGFQKWCQDWATEALRVLKPGGHLLAFGGTRTYHRLVCGIEDAGFEIRDTIMWLYGSGFPKSLDISKAIDKRRATDIKKFAEYIKEKRGKKRLSLKELNLKFGYVAGCNWWESKEDNFRYPNWEDYQKLKILLNLDDRYDNNLRVEVGKKVGERNRGNAGFSNEQVPRPWKKKIGEAIDITLPATPEAKQWEGWGTALKPACEPIVVARKPLSESTVAENVLKWGTGGIDIDGGRIGHNEPLKETNRKENMGNSWDSSNCGLRVNPNNIASANPQGRFPSNVILDEQAGAMLDEQAPMTGAFAKVKSGHSGKSKGIYHDYAQRGDDGETFYNDGLQGASRFFYCAKASKSERNRGCENLYWLNGELTTKEIWEKLNKENEGNKDNKNFKRHNIARGNIHPTVKSLSLMEYLIKLYSTKDAVIIDPFCGSGTTAIGCKNTGRKYIVIDNEKEYIEIAKCRVRAIPETLF